MRFKYKRKTGGGGGESYLSTPSNRNTTLLLLQVGEITKVCVYSAVGFVRGRDGGKDGGRRDDVVDVCVYGSISWYLQLPVTRHLDVVCIIFVVV